MKNDIAILEGLLFIVGEEGLSEQNIKEILEVGDLEFNYLIKDYQNQLLNENRGLTLKCLGNRYKLTTKPEYYSYYQKLALNPANFNFSNAMLETLAIIAYNQPITRMEIENIRGVNSDHIVKKLLGRNLIKGCGRKDTIGKPLLYEVTHEFLDYFNLENLEELPEIDIDEEDGERDLFETSYREQ